MVNFQVKRGKKTKEVSSNFMITVNPNQAYEDEDQARAAESFLRQTLEALFARFDSFLVPKKEAIGVPLEDNIILSDIEYNVEIGADKKRLHSHTLVKIKQRQGYYHVNQALLRRYFEAVYGYPVHINIRFIHDDTMTIKRYINKAAE